MLPKNFYKEDFESFFPLSTDSHQSSIGIHFQNIAYKHNSVISLSPALAPHDSLKKAFMGDLMNDPRALANTLSDCKKQKVDYRTILATSLESSSHKDPT